MPDPVSRALPQSVLDQIAAALTEHVHDHRAGHCVRVDNLRAEDAENLAMTLRAGPAGHVADVLVLVDSAKETEKAFHVHAERAVELRNRKQRQLVLLVPVGVGAAASSLDNSFERRDAVELLRAASESLASAISDVDGVRSGIRRVAETLGKRRPVEAWARYVAAVSANPTWDTVGSDLPSVGLIPDRGGPDLVDRLARNAKCVAEISRPARAVASIVDRLDKARIQAGPIRDKLAEFLADPRRDLANPAEWTADLIASDLSLENWPLVEPQTVAVSMFQVEPFLRANGAVVKATGLKQDLPGDLPYTEAGEDNPASLRVSWTTTPKKADAIYRWRLEVVTPQDVSDDDDNPIAKVTVAGSRRSAKIPIEITESDLDKGSLFIVRVTGVDTSGQPVQLMSGEAACDESQQFIIRWEADLITGDSRRNSTWSLALGRLDAVVSGQNDLTEDAYSLDDQHSALSLRLGGRRTLHLGVSPGIVALQRQVFGGGQPASAYAARGRMGVALTADELEPNTLDLPAALSKQRGEVNAALSAAQPRDLVESLIWDKHLRELVKSYCQAYKRALDQSPSDPAHRAALLTMDTLSLEITTSAGKPIRAVVVLPFHPLRLAWLAEYDTVLTEWARELADSGMTRDQRRRLVDTDLLRRVTPANLPFAVPGPETDAIYVHAREATVGTGIYLSPSELEPGIAVQAVLDVLGIHRDDAATDVPSSLVTDHLDTYLATHSSPESLRLLAINAGSGELLARTLNHVMVSDETTADGEETTTRVNRRVELIAYGTRMSDTDPVPALTDLQRTFSKHRVGATRSYLRPPLGLSVRSFDRLATDTAPAHVCVVSNLATMTTANASAAPAATASFRNLLTPTSNRRVEDADGSTYWESTPALRLREFREARNKDGAADTVDAHRAHQTALAAWANLPAEHGIALRMRLNDEQSVALAAAHDRADWVLSIGGNVGPEQMLSGDPEANQPYILDYAPDFLEGIGPRITVTTKHRDEIAGHLSSSLRALGFPSADDRVRAALGHLQLVSGRVALRLTESTESALDAAALSVYLADLSTRVGLTDTIVVPVDAHREMFALGADGPRLADLLLVRVNRQGIRIHCVSVVARTRNVPMEELVDDLADRLGATVEVFAQSLLGVDRPRLDVDLQRAKLAGILRHHATRAFGLGLLNEERLATAERQFARIEDGINPEIVQSGCVVSLDATDSFTREYRGIQVEVLTAPSSAGSGSPTRSAVSRVVPPSPAQVRGTSESRDDSAASTTDNQRATQPQAQPDELSRSAPDELSRSAPDELSQSAPAEADPPSERPEPSTTRDSSTDSSFADGRAVPEQIEVALGTDTVGAEVTWRISTAGSPHMFILGIPGQGKSVTTRRILNSFADQGLPAIVLDFHGDMAAAPPAGAAVVDAAEGLNFSPFEMRADVDHHKFPQTAWELAEVIGYVSGLGEIQRNVVYDTLMQLYGRHGFGQPSGPTSLPTMTQFARLLAQNEGAGNGRNVAARTRPLSDFGLFATDPTTTPFAELLTGGVVLDLHTLMEQVQLAASAFVLRKIYQEMFRWGKSDRLRLAVVLDEAHRLAKDVTLPKIMKEGRKYGVAVVVASQGIDDFHRDVLGTAGTKLAFRCNFPQSKTVAGFLRGQSGFDMAISLEKLAVGQAFISTPDVPEARKVSMHPE
ncbi:helicase HerA domain-containing protein [Nocardia sp. NPDC058640]|uniref:helicase HerA domain-containing protein n=1 Tax=Nocardia sp. NPDC058640 TaxID=3346571 RepID=UPI003667DE1C